VDFEDGSLVVMGGGGYVDDFEQSPVLWIRLDGKTWRRMKGTI
jgi:hypothetical protein